MWILLTSTCLWRWNRQSVPKRWHISSRRQGITQKKAYNMQNTAKTGNQAIHLLTLNAFMAWRETILLYFRKLRRKYVLIWNGFIFSINSVPKMFSFFPPTKTRVQAKADPYETCGVRWQWNRFSSEYYHFPLSVSFHHCSIRIFDL